MNDTPETDAKASEHIGFYSCATVPAELCRRLERERNEAYTAFQELWQFADEFLPDIPDEMADRWNKFFKVMP